MGNNDENKTNWHIKNTDFKGMSSEGMASLDLVNQFISALLRRDEKALLDLLADELILDYSGKFGYGKNTLNKTEAILFHKKVRESIELVDFNLLMAYGEANTVFLLGDKTEKIMMTEQVVFEKCIWIYTLENNLICKIQYLPEGHTLFPFFSGIMDNHQKRR